MTKRVTKRATKSVAATPANETARKLVLAGLGAVSLAQKQGEKIMDTLVAEGTQFQARTTKFRTTLVKDAKKTATDVEKKFKKATTDVSKQVRALVTPYRTKAINVVRDVETGLTERIGAVLGRFGVPSKSDLDELLGRVSDLNTQVKASARRRAA